MKTKDKITNNKKEVKLILVTNCPTPYRTKFYNAVGQDPSLKFLVLYATKIEKFRSWTIDEKDMTHNHIYLKGVSINIGSYIFHINPGVIYILWKEKPTKILLAGSWNMPTTILALIFAKISGVKVAFWSEGHADSVKLESVVGLARKLFYKMIDEFVVPNQRSHLYAQNLGGKNKNIFNVANTIDEGIYRSFSNEAADNGLIRKNSFIRRDLQYIVISYLEERKGVREIIDIFLSNKKIYDRSRLVIVGDGPKYKEYCELINKNSCKSILMLGWLEPESIGRLLESSHFAIMNSRIDPNPLAVVECASKSTVLLLRDTVGNSEEFSDVALIHQNDNSLETNLLKTMNMSMSEYELRSSKTLKIFSEVFSLDKNVQSFVEFATY